MKIFCLFFIVFASTSILWAASPSTELLQTPLLKQLLNKHTETHLEAKQTRQTTPLHTIHEEDEEDTRKISEFVSRYPPFHGEKAMNENTQLVFCANASVKTDPQCAKGEIAKSIKKHPTEVPNFSRPLRRRREYTSVTEHILKEYL